MKKNNGILTEKQKLFLSLVSQNKLISKNFYLTGGTALCEHYIPYRLSDDLDFFSEKEFDVSYVSVFLKSVKKDLNYNKLEINSSFNRNIFQLIFPKYVLKVEFTYFPFPQIENPRINDGIKIDSLTDIATNKLFTIYQNPRTRDYMDLYMINKQFKLNIQKLILKAKSKFDWHVDPIKLGSQFIKCKDLKDYPKIISEINDDELQSYFYKEAKKLKNKIF